MLVLSLGLWLFSCVHAVESLVNVKALQTVDLSKSYLRQTVDLIIQNTGDEPVSGYTFLIPRERNQLLATIVSRDSKSDGPLDITVGDAGSLADEFDAYSIKLTYPLKPQAKVQLGVVMAFAETAEPYPREAKQSESQFLLYSGAKNYVSVYPTESSETQLTLITEKYTVLEESEDSEPQITPKGFLEFGPYTDVEPFTNWEFTMQYENPLPVIRIEQLNRTVWVSHWGRSVSFEESYDVHNVGTRAKAPFSRLDFRMPKVGFSLNKAAIKSMRLVLPENHREEFYVDLVGNVSTSVVNSDSLDITPRYPVMGGWFYNFTVGWASNLGNFVHESSKNAFVLQVPLIDGPDSVGYTSASTTVVLPEGATGVEVYSEVPATELRESVTYSYLDLYGRPTVEIDFKNVVSEMKDKHIYIAYTYSSAMFLRKPITYAVAVYLVLMSLKLAKHLL